MLDTAKLFEVAKLGTAKICRHHDPRDGDYALANLAIGGINLTANFIFGIWLNLRTFKSLKHSNLCLIFIRF